MVYTVTAWRGSVHHSSKQAPRGVFSKQLAQLRAQLSLLPARKPAELETASMQSCNKVVRDASAAGTPLISDITAFGHDPLPPLPICLCERGSDATQAACAEALADNMYAREG